MLRIQYPNVQFSVKPDIRFSEIENLATSVSTIQRIINIFQFCEAVGG